jgi:predicted RNA-binding Zn-ribbon protein involved in translation (DUF1610 family)
MSVTLRVRQQHYCIPCRAWTEHEREATLPARYRCGDPDYEDRSKCGRCGEVYQCQECGAPFDVDARQCEAVLDHGYHGPEDQVFELIADGIRWEDADGRTSWPGREAAALAEVVGGLGYQVEMRPA